VGQTIHQLGSLSEYRAQSVRVNRESEVVHRQLGNTGALGRTTLVYSTRFVGPRVAARELKLSL
jgi:hypothetical protein